MKKYPPREKTKPKTLSRDLTIESYRKKDDEPYFATQRIEPMVKNVEATVRGIPDKLPPHDTFLAYLEWKTTKHNWWKFWK